MSNEDLNQEEEVQETKPTTESESDDASELDELFADDSQEEEGEDKVAALEKKISNIEKGVKKYFSEQGRKAKEVEPKKVAETKPVETDDVSELFYAQVPNAELVQDDLKVIADAKYNGSILKAWKNEKWIQEKSNALADAKKEDEENKSKISKPSNNVSFSKKIASLKEEEIGSLTPDQKVEWLEEQVRRERMNVD